MASRKRGLAVTSPAQPRGDGDFLDEAREQLAAFGVLPPFAVLNIGPLGMTGHLLPLLALSVNWSVSVLPRRVWP